MLYKSVEIFFPFPRTKDKKKIRSNAGQKLERFSDTAADDTAAVRSKITRREQLGQDRNEFQSHDLKVEFSACSPSRNTISLQVSRNFVQEKLSWSFALTRGITDSQDDQRINANLVGRTMSLK